MDAPFFERLPALDAAMVFLETDAVMMHVGMLGVFESAGVCDAEGNLDHARVRSHCVGALESLPRYRQRLAYTPIEGHPIWVDTEHFDPAHHVRFHRLPAPAGDAELRRLAGAVLGTRLDPRHPLWEMHFVEGLAGGRFAIVVKMHHCMVDGMAAMQVFSAFFSPDPTAIAHRGHAHAARPMPSGLSLVQSELGRRLGSIAAIARALRPTEGASRTGLGPRGLTPRGMVEALRTKTTLATSTPLNPGSVGLRRSYAYTSVELATLKRVKKALSGTVNDAVLAIVAGAVHRFFLARGVAPDRTPVHVVMPVDARAVTGKGEGLGNRVVPTLVRLPLEFTSPTERFRAINGTTRGLKSSGQIEGVVFLEDLANLAVVRPLAALVKVATRLWAGNFIVTNLPGPPFPVYFLGARMLAAYPVVPIMANQAVGIALLSYAGRLHFGLLADPDALPDVDTFVECIDREIVALVQAAEAAEVAGPK